MINLHTTIYSTRKIGDSLTEFIIYSPKLIKTIDIGEFVKFQNYISNSCKLNGDCYLFEPIALTPIYLDYQNNLVHFIVNERGASTKLISNLKAGDEIVSMGAIGEKFDVNIFKDKKVLFISSGFRHYINLFLMEEIFRDIKTAKITLLSDGLDEIDEFYKERLKFYSHNLIDCYQNTEKFNNFIEENCKDFDVIVLGDSSKDLKNEVCSLNKVLVCMRDVTMHCMMDGLCGRCVQMDNNGNHFYSCGRSRYYVNDENFPDLSFRMKQQSLMEKIDYLKLKKICNKDNKK